MQRTLTEIQSFPLLPSLPALVFCPGNNRKVKSLSVRLAKPAAFFAWWKSLRRYSVRLLVSLAWCSPLFEEDAGNWTLDILQAEPLLNPWATSFLPCTSQPMNWILQVRAYVQRGFVCARAQFDLKERKRSFVQIICGVSFSATVLCSRGERCAPIPLHRNSSLAIAWTDARTHMR